MSIPNYKLNSGHIIPLLGIGTWKSDKGVMSNTIKTAIDAGYRHIDCAALYGNQKEIGIALSEVFKEGKVKREDLFITSKVWVTHLRPDHVVESVKNTLAELQLTYLDLLLIHWPIAFVYAPTQTFDVDGKPKLDNVPLHLTWKAFENLVKEKVVRSIGVSNFSVQHLNNLLNFAEILPSVNQVEVHPFLPQTRLIDFCHAHNILVTCYCPIARPGPASDKVPTNINANETIVSIAKKYNKTPTQIVLRWGLQRSGIDSYTGAERTYDNVAVIPKATSKEHITENISIFDFTLSAEDVRTLSSLSLGTDARLADPVKIFHTPLFD